MGPTVPLVSRATYWLEQIHRALVLSCNNIIYLFNINIYVQLNRNKIIIIMMSIFIINNNNIILHVTLN